MLLSSSLVLLVLIFGEFMFSANAFGLWIKCALPPLPNIKLEECCVEPKMDRSPYADECAGRYLQNEKPGQTVIGMACFAECLFNATQMLVNGGQHIDFVRVQKITDQRLSQDPVYIPVMMKSFQKCVPIAANKLTKFTMNSWKSDCNPFAKFIMDCVQRENFANCPPSKWKPSPACDFAKKYAIKCI